MTDHEADRGPEQGRASDPYVRVRMPGDWMDTWQRFGGAVRQAEPNMDRSKVLREFMRYYVGDTDRLPQRPFSAAPASGEDQQP